MTRLIKWCVLPAVLVAGFLVAAPQQANAGGFSFSINSGYPSYGYGGYGGYRSYGASYGPGWYVGGSPYRYGGHGYGHGFGGGRGIGYGGYRGPGHHHHNHCW